jgi:uncharacterized membrane protein
VLNAIWLALWVMAFRTEGLVEIATNIRSDVPDAILRMAQVNLRITLAVFAAVCAVLVATDVVRLVRR